MSRRLSYEQIVENFWARVDKVSSPTGCWLWTGRLSEKGYGMFSAPSVFGTLRDVRAHRFAYVLLHGPIPDDMLVLHKPPCNTRACVRHLYLGTPKQNTQDAKSLHSFPTGKHHAALRDNYAVLPHGDDHWTHTNPERIPRGQNHWSATLSGRLPHGDDHWTHTNPELVRRGERHHAATITAQLVRNIRADYAAGMQQPELRQKYHLPRGHIWAIVHFKTWKHATNDQ